MNQLYQGLIIGSLIPFWLVVSTHLKNISQNGNLHQIGVNMKISKYLKPPPRLLILPMDLPSRFHLLLSEKPKALRIGQQGIFPQRPFSGNNGDKKRQEICLGFRSCVFVWCVFFVFCGGFDVSWFLIFDDSKKICYCKMPNCLLWMFCGCSFVQVWVKLLWRPD